MWAVSDVLTVEGLEVGYDNTTVLEGFDVHVGAREIVAVCGPNGAGKSTLLRTLAGQLAPRGGTIVFDGRSVVGVEPSALVSRGIALCPEGRRVFPRMSTEANLWMGAYGRKDRDQVRQDVEDYLDAWPVIARRRDLPAALLSGGEQQVLAIGRALMSDPRLLLLDEPSLGLAPVLIDQVYRGLQAIVQERELSVLLVEQNVVKAMELADRVAVLSQGTKTFESAVHLVTADEVGSHYFEQRGRN